MNDSFGKSYKTIVVISLLFLLTLTGIFFNCYYHYKDIKYLALTSDKTTANFLQKLLIGNQRVSVSLLRSYTNRPEFVNNIKERNEKNILSELAHLKNNNDGIDWLYLSDRNGILWANYPVAKIAHGKDLSHRDWYKGVRKEWKPYISAVFKLIVGAKELGIAICVPVFDQEGQVIAIIGNTQRISFLQDLIERVPFDKYAKVTLIDHEGHIVYSNTNPPGKSIVIYPFLSHVKKAILEQKDVFEINDPERGSWENYVTTSLLKNFGWTIIVERSGKDILLSGIRYYIQTTLIAMLLFIIIVVSFFYISRRQEQVILKKSRDDLEQLVSKRTEELERINEELENDITDRKQAEKKLADSEERYRHTFEKNPAVKLIINPEDGSIIEANNAACKFYGYSKNKIMSLKIYDINVLSPDKVVEAMENAKSEKKLYFNFPHKLASGEIRDVEEYTGPVKYGQSTFLHSIVHDITDRKKNELVLKRQALAMDHSSDTIVITDTSGIINYINPAFKKISGYENTEVFGKNLSILKSGVHDAQFYKELWDTISGGEVWSGQFTNKKKDGSEYIEEATISPVFSKEGEIINYVAVKRDITDRLKLETKLRQAQKMESIGTLAGGIAHDFNNILSSIIGFTELALGEAENGTDLEDDLQEVRKAGLRAKDLVRQILTFARQSDEAPMPIQIDIIVKEVLTFIKSSIPSTIQINNNIYSDSLIMGSSTQIHQVLMNLCTNAAQAMEEKGGILEVSVNDTTIDKMAISDLKPGEYIEIKVSDTGVGIAPQNLHAIFDPYFTTKPVGEGTGMGLAVVHGIVENYGGKITVASTIGKGTCFTIYLPISKKRKKLTSDKEQDLPLGNERILFVDDEVPIAKMGSKMLEQLGYSVTTRTSSVEALELFKSKPQAFDLVVTDMTMPNMTGDKLVTEMMKIRSDIPVVLCTGYSKKISQESAADIGIKALVYKPVVKSDLAKTVRKVLDENE